MNELPYGYALSVTSQFFFCSLPLRLDAYSRCGFGCSYCFALARGGNFDIRRTKVADPDALERRLARVVTGRAASVVDEFLMHRQPIHLGGMSDPFPPIERKLGIGKQLLRVLAQYKYPTVISTKNALVANDEYLELLTSGSFVVQVSLSSLNDEQMQQIDVGASLPSARMRAVEKLVDAGVPTSCRIQPILPSLEQDARDVVFAAAAAGARHVGVEHLKLPIESSWRGTGRLAKVLAPSALTRHVEAGQRVGREWVLPVEDRIDTVLAMREYAHDVGLTFGAADNDLLPISDGNCCCSGVDFIDGFGDYFECNYTEAIRRSYETRTVSYGRLRDIWCPTMTMARFINSKSRIVNADGSSAGIRDYVMRNWNGSPNGSSPLSFLGVEASETRSDDGMIEYTINDELHRLMAGRFVSVRGALNARQ